MTALSAAFREIGSHARILAPVWVAIALTFAALAAAAPDQAGASSLFAGGTLLETAPFLVLAVTIAAYARASGADGLIANAFHGREVRMVLVTAPFGAL